MKHCQIICSPYVYYSQACQNLIVESIKSENNRWIYGVDSSDKEAVLYDDRDFTICKDIPKKDDKDQRKMLIIFKDRSLRTIRDLRHKHTTMLLRAWEQGMRQTIKFKGKWSIYFNYLPSNYQLHAHISPEASAVHLRAHQLRRIVNNLSFNNFFYRDALLLTRLSRNNAVFPAYEYNFTDISYTMNKMLGVTVRKPEFRVPETDKDIRESNPTSSTILPAPILTCNLTTAHNHQISGNSTKEITGTTP